MINGINSREMILEILLEIEEGEHSHVAIRNALSKYQFLPKQDRAFITRVCEGTLEYRIFPFLADFSSGTDLFHTGTYNCRNCAVFTGRAVPACDPSGGV